MRPRDLPYDRAALHREGTAYVTRMTGCRSVHPPVRRVGRAFVPLTLCAVSSLLRRMSIKTAEALARAGARGGLVVLERMVC